MAVHINEYEPLEIMAYGTMGASTTANSNIQSLEPSAVLYSKSKYLNSTF